MMMQRVLFIVLIFIFGLFLNSLYYESVPLLITSVVLLLICLGWIYRQYLGHPRGSWKYWRKDWLGAVEQFTMSINKFPRDAFALFMRGNSYYRLKQHDAALQDFTRALDLKPNWVLCHYNVAYISYEREDYAASLAHAEVCLQHQPKWLYALAIRGASHFELKQFDAARADFEMILRLYPASGHAQLGLSALCLKQGDYDEAIHLCSDIAHVKRVRSVALNNRAYAYALKGDLETSLRDCNQGIAEYPDFTNLYGTRGHTYFLMGHYQEALADFRQQEALKPTDAFAIAGQAVTLSAQDDFEAARETWQRLTALKPEYTNVQKFDEEYYPARPFIEEADEIATSFNPNEGEPHDAVSLPS